MGYINIDLDGVMSTDYTLVEIANEIKDISLRGEELEYLYVTNFLGITNQIISANNYLKSACTRTANLRNLVKKAVSNYEHTELTLDLQMGGGRYIVNTALKSFEKLVKGDVIQNLGSDYRMMMLDKRDEEEDYEICIQYNYSQGATETYTKYKNVEREYVGAEYDQDTGELVSYDIRKQYIRSGETREYVFEDKSTYKTEEFYDVKNIYDGNEKDEDKNKTINASSYDVKSERIDYLYTEEAVEKNQAAKITMKEGISQSLTNWDLEKSDYKAGEVKGSRTRKDETTIEYTEGTNLIEDSDSWTNKRSIKTTNDEEKKVAKGYASADLVAASVGVEYEYTVAKVETKYQIKGNTIQTIEANMTGGHVDIGFETEGSVLNGNKEINITALASGKIKINAFEGEAVYTESDLSGNEIYSTKLEMNLGLSKGSSKGVKNNTYSESGSYDGELCGVGISGSSDVVNTLIPDKNVGGQYTKKDNVTFHNRQKDMTDKENK